MDLIQPHVALKRSHAREDSGLRHRGAILLLSCYELGHQPAGLSEPMAFLEQAGYAPVGLDLSVEPFDAERVTQARLVGISVPMHTALRLGVRAAARVRELNPGSHICFYGLYASLNAEYLLSQSANSVIGGEYHGPLVELIERLQAGLPITAMDGISVAGRIAPPHLGRLRATVPFPSRAGLPSLDRYARLERDGGRHVTGYVEASRGCLHTCLHCPIVPVYDGRFFLVPEEIVLEDIRRQIEAGATHITFGDPDFLNGPGHSLAIVRAMHAAFPHVTFDFTAKIEHLLKRRTLLPELAAAGCLFVVSAAESFSDLVLAHLQKGHTRADILEAVTMLRAAGITLRPSLVAFTPWTTLDDYVDMFDLVEAHDLIEAVDPVQYTIRLLVPPGSALLERDGLPGPVHDFVTELDQPGFQYRWTHPDPRMDALHRMVTDAMESAAKGTDDPSVTFETLKRLAYRIAGRPSPPPMKARATGPRPPRLTEAWFCCAEPTRDQLGSLG